MITYLHDADGADATRREVAAAGRTAIVVQTDISGGAQVAAAFDRAVEEFGKVDILLNNAGVDASGSDVADLSTEVWNKAIRTNVYGPSSAAAASSKSERSTEAAARSSNVTSVHEDIPNAGSADYDCSRVPSATSLGRWHSSSPVEDQRQQPGTRHGADPVQPGSHQRSRPARGAGAEHPVQTRSRAGGDRPPCRLPGLRRRRLLHPDARSPWTVDWPRTSAKVPDARPAGRRPLSRGSGRDYAVYGRSRRGRRRGGCSGRSGRSSGVPERPCRRRGRQ